MSKRRMGCDQIGKRPWISLKIKITSSFQRDPGCTERERERGKHFDRGFPLFSERRCSTTAEMRVLRLRVHGTRGGGRASRSFSSPLVRRFKLREAWGGVISENKFCGGGCLESLHHRPSQPPDLMQHFYSNQADGRDKRKGCDGRLWRGFITTWREAGCSPDHMRCQLSVDWSMQTYTQR